MMQQAVRAELEKGWQGHDGLYVSESYKDSGREPRNKEEKVRIQSVNHINSATLK